MLNLGLGFLFTARDLASSKLTQLEQRFQSLDARVTGGTESMTSSFRQLGLGLATFTSGAILVGGALSMANAAGRFEQGISAIGSVTRAGTKELNLLRTAAIDAGIATQFSPDEAVEGLLSLATAGQTALQSTQTLIPVLDLAAGSLGQLGVAQAAEAVVGTLNAYGLAADQSAGVTDKLLRITQLTNFMTRDFEAGLAKAAATGSVFGQSLDDVLIAMGLLRNRNIDASSSATAFREAVRRVGAESRAQNALLGVGIDIFDRSSGKMRSIIDIIGDVATVTRSMSEAERNRRVVTAFGARGLLAFNAVLNASFTTLRDGSEVTLRGAEAIAAMRQELGEAAGTAQGFREKLLDTFAGQKTLLQGTLQTYAVVLGEPFAQVFKPIVRTVVESLNALLHTVLSIPAPLKRLLAGLVVTAGSFLMVVGGAIAGKASLLLLSLGLKALGLSLGGLVATILPAVLILMALGTVISGVTLAMQHNVGNLGDVVKTLGTRLSLFFGGLKQLIEQGGFSGAVREELNKNLGIKAFLIRIYQLGARFGSSWQGLTAGFVSSLDKARPIFTALGQALLDLVAGFSSLAGGFAKSGAALPSSAFLGFGQLLGTLLGTVVRWCTTLLTVALRVAVGVQSGFGALRSFLGPVLTSLGRALTGLFNAWNQLTTATITSDEAASTTLAGWQVLGQAFGLLAGGALLVLLDTLTAVVETLNILLSLVDAVATAFGALGTWIGESAAKIFLWFENLPELVSSTLGLLDPLVAFFTKQLGALYDLVRSLASGLSTLLDPLVERFRSLGLTLRAALGNVLQWLQNLLQKIPETLLPETLIRFKHLPLEQPAVTPVAPQPRPRGNSLVPAVAETTTRSRDFERFLSLAQPQKKESQSLMVNVQVDGETIARAVHHADQANAARAFLPVPVY